MDSVLTSLVEDERDHSLELEKSVKKILGRDYVYPIRDVEHSFKLLISSLKSSEKKEVIISSLAPSFVYTILRNFGFTPVVLDVLVDSGVYDLKVLEDKINDNTAYIVNNSVFGVLASTEIIMDFGIPVIELLVSGLGKDSSGELFASKADYSIISLEGSNIPSSMGGAILTFDSEDKKSFIDIELENKPYLKLSSLNSSFALSQFPDLEMLFDKKEAFIPAFKDSVLKSGYHTLENQEINMYNSFPVVLKRGLNDAQKYCRKQGVETSKGFYGTIVQEIDEIKCKNAKSLCNRTLNFPIYLGMGKDSIELILKILSTLP